MINDTLTASVKDRLRQFLPDAMARALHSYEVFLTAALPDDPKGFMAHHQACKMAIAHIELLVKLTRLITPTDDNTIAPASTLGHLIAEAEAEIDSYDTDHNSHDTD